MVIVADFLDFLPRIWRFSATRRYCSAFWLCQKSAEKFTHNEVPLGETDSKHLFFGEISGRLLLPGAHRTPPYLATDKGLISVLKLLTQPEQLERSCHLQLSYGPISVEPYRAKTHLLHPRRSYFAPITYHRDFNVVSVAYGGGAGYRPRVRMVYYDGHLSP